MFHIKSIKILQKVGQLKPQN